MPLVSVGGKKIQAITNKSLELVKNFTASSNLLFYRICLNGKNYVCPEYLQ